MRQKAGEEPGHEATYMCMLILKHYTARETLFLYKECTNLYEPLAPSSGEQ